MFRERQRNLGKAPAGRVHTLLIETPSECGPGQKMTSLSRLQTTGAPAPSQRRCRCRLFPAVILQSLRQHLAGGCGDERQSNLICAVRYCFSCEGGAGCQYRRAGASASHQRATIKVARLLHSKFDLHRGAKAAGRVRVGSRVADRLRRRLCDYVFIQQIARERRNAHVFARQGPLKRSVEDRV